MDKSRKVPARARTRALSQAPTIYHERLGNQHRIVRVEAGKPVDGGDWAHEADVAQLGGLRATTPASKLPLPAGVFVAKSVDHVV